MLIRFSVQNFMSFKQAATLNMERTLDTEHEDTHTFSEGPTDLLKSAVIYGANASGKSNFIAAINFMKQFVRGSSKESTVADDIEVESYRLSSETEKQPSMFEIEFIKNDVKYRYGFSADTQRIHEEWLYHLPYKESKREIQLFSRQFNIIEPARKTVFDKEAKGLKEKTRENALFLSVVANFNGPISINIMEWFENFDLMSGMNNNGIGFTMEMLKDPLKKKKILDVLKIIDIGIEDLQVEEVDIHTNSVFKHLPKEIAEKLKSAVILFSSRKKYDESDQFIGLESFDFSDSESEGTKKFLGLLGPILDKLENGGVLVVDELDAKLHPLLTNTIVNIFNSFDMNRNQAQLVYATHDVINLSNKEFRRDQIWFVEKDERGSSSLYSLADIKDDKKVRKDASFSKQYLLGKYGGTPDIGSLQLVLGGINENS